jgi:putative inorganic carbon (hco3(-)) transporter
MKLKNIFNITLFSFIMIVTLIPIKFKFYMIPISSDFILGSALIIIGLLCVLSMYFKKLKLYEPLNNLPMIVLSAAILIYTLIGMFSITYASHKSVAISECMRFLEYVFIFYFIIIIADEKTIDRSLTVFYFTMIFAAMFGVSQLLFNWSTFELGGFFGRGRIFSTFVNPNYWGAAINLVIFYPVINLLDGGYKCKDKLFHLGTLGLFFFNLIFCATRGSWIGFIIGLITICGIKYKKKLIYIIGITTALGIIPIVRNRFLDMFVFNERLRLWKTGLYMCRDHFFTGVGNGNYIFQYGSYIEKYKELDLGRLKVSVQNSYIKTLAELGVFGGITFIIIYFSIFNLVYRVYKSSRKYSLFALAYIGFGAAYLFQNFFNNLVFIPQLNVFVWILAALLYKGLYLERRVNQYGQE